MGSRISYDGDTVSIDNAMELLIALTLTPASADKEILDQLSGDITAIVTNDDDFLKILAKVLGGKDESKIPYLSNFGNQLHKVVSDGDTVARALALMAREDDQKFFLKTLGQDYLRAIVNSLDEIGDCMEWLYGKMDIFFLELLGWEYIINYIKTGEGLGKLLCYIVDDQETELIEQMGWPGVFERIRTIEDLYQVLTGMTPQNERKMLEKISPEKVREVLPFPEQLEKICTHYLSDEDARILRAKYAE